MSQEILKWHREFTMISSLDLTGKLPFGAAEMYGIVEHEAQQLNISYFIIGATARDIILYHGFNAQLERGTRDIDFAIQLESWDNFHALKECLQDRGFYPHNQHPYKLNYTSSKNEPWEIDILPFGQIADTDNDIAWPPEGEIKMSVLGFQEALESAWHVRISPQTMIKVASPIGVVLLKLIAWTERDAITRRKDIQDIAYIISNYSKVNTIYEALYQDDYMQRFDYDEELATAALIATQLMSISSKDTQDYLSHKIKPKEQQEKILADCQSSRVQEILRTLIERLC